MNADKIAELIQKQLNEVFTEVSDKTFYRGIVVGIRGRMVDVLVEGNDFALPGVVCLASYHPQLNDKVLLVNIGRTGTNFIALQKIDQTGLVINLIENPSAETNTDGWSVLGGTSDRFLQSSIAGSYVYRNTRTAGGGGARYTANNLIAGQSYIFLYFARGTGTGGIVRILHDDFLLYDEPVAVGWGGIDGGFTAFANAPLQIEITPGSVAGNEIALDGMMLTEGDLFYDYFDGSTSFAGLPTSWDGTAHASTSRSFVRNTNNEWFNPSMQNSWIRYDTVWSAQGFMRDHNGFIHLRGLIKGGVVGSSAFTLPVGYRPGSQLLISTISNGAVGRIKVGTNGQIIPETPSSNVWVALDGITFKADDSGL